MKHSVKFDIIQYFVDEDAHFLQALRELFLKVRILPSGLKLDGYHAGRHDSSRNFTNRTLAHSLCPRESYFGLGSNDQTHGASNCPIAGNSFLAALLPQALIRKHQH